MAEKRKAIFLDKDGTLIPDIPYNVDPDLVTLASGVIEGLKILKEIGYIFIVISNQSGVAKGYFEYDELENVKNKLDLLLVEEQLHVIAYYFCPHYPSGRIAEFAVNCDCRKPKPGMILQAAKDFDIDIHQSWMIGDILNDVEAGNKAGCKTILLDMGNETEWEKGLDRNPVFIASDFLHAARFIYNNSNAISVN